MFFSKLTKKQKEIQKEAKTLCENLKRNRVLHHDTMKAKNLEKVDRWLSRYKEMMKGTDPDWTGVESLNAEVLQQAKATFPLVENPDVAENVEVFVVAAIMALAIRTFFLQPFFIPTGSMEPTLSGVEPTHLSTPAPNAIVQIYDRVILGESYVHMVTKTGGEVQSLEEGSYTMWFPYTVVHLDNGTKDGENLTFWLRKQDVNRLGIDKGVRFPAGDVWNGVVQSGDVVLVDKVSYNFRKPRRGEVIIFQTLDINHPQVKANMDSLDSLDYIKRCVALPGDKVTVDPPHLYINGELAKGSTIFDKQFYKTDPYKGYFTVGDEQLKYECNYPPTVDGNKQTWVVPDHAYWAMGDNSSNSLDSRYWGGVPEKNLAGRGLIVLWPFTERWGFIP